MLIKRELIVALMSEFMPNELRIVLAARMNEDAHSSSFMRAGKHLTELTFHNALSPIRNTETEL